MSPPTTIGTARQMIELDAAMAVHLLDSVDFGRLVFTSKAMPAIRPVNHIVDAGEIVICTRLPTATTGYTPGVRLPEGTVVAYEADCIDVLHRIGWSVVVTGIAAPITDPVRIDRCVQRLDTWMQHPGGILISIKPQLVTGYQLSHQ